MISLIRIGVRGSQPARAVWIEISASTDISSPGAESQPARAVWIEISVCLYVSYPDSGHSLRGLCGLKF